MRGFAKPDPVEDRGDEFCCLSALLDHLRATVHALHALETRVPEAESRDGVIDAEVQARTSTFSPKDALRRR